MKFVFVAYVVTKEYASPETWLHRIRMHTGILEALSNHHEVTSIQQIDYEGEYNKKGVNYQFIKLSKAGRYFPRKLHRFIKDQEPDVVMVQGLHCPLQVIQLRRKLGSKAAIILQHHAEKPFIGFKKYWQRWADRYVDAYLFASNNMGMDWVKKGNLESAKKIHEVMEVSTDFYPIDKEVAKAKTGIIGQPVFLWVGRLDQNKDPICVVKAFLKYAATQPTARLYMLYQTTELLPEINELLKDHDCKNSVVLIGSIPNEELLYWYNSADVILSGSHYEGAGAAICEAMACGCVPIVTNIPSFRMMTDHGKCGILYEAGNETDLLNALLQVHAINISQKKKITIAHFESTLSFKAIAGRMETIAGAFYKI